MEKTAADSRFVGELMEAKPALVNLTKKFKAANMSEFVRNVLLQLEREVERTGADSISYGDIIVRIRK